jgi:cysteine desulfurase family protein
MIYLDNAATTFPKPESTYQYIDKYMRNIAANPGRGSHSMAIKSAEIIFSTREALAELFNIEDPMNIVFTKNCTESINVGIKGFLKKGDHVITTSMEHNSVLRPLSKMKEKGVEVSIVKGDEFGSINPQTIFNNITNKTKMIITTHASNLTGTIMPIKEIGEICKDNKLTYMVDAAQSAGILDIDIKECNIDMLAFPGHKGLYGPMGIGGLYLNPDLDLDTFIEGGTGSKSSEITQPLFMPDKFESGTPNLVGIAGLMGGLEFIKSIGTNNIRYKIQKMAHHFREAICSTWNIKIYGSKKAENNSGIVLVNIKGMDSAIVSNILDTEFQIATRPGLHCAPLAHKSIGTEDTGAVRFSLSSFTTIEDIEKASVALIKIAKKAESI